MATLSSVCKHDFAKSITRAVAEFCASTTLLSFAFFSLNLMTVSMKFTKIFDSFSRNVVLLFFGGLFVLVVGVTLSALVRYKPYGVPEHRRADYEAKIAEIRLRESLLSTNNTKTFPRAIVDDTFHDFGMLDPHSTASHPFKVTNEGTDPLALEVIGTSCKCTTGDLVDGLLQPGESTEVTLTWNTGRESDVYEQTAILRTNDPLSKEIKLTVQGTVKVEIKVPEEVSFSGCDPGELAKVSFFVYSQVWEQFEIEEVVGDFAQFEWHATPMDTDSPEFLAENAKSAWTIEAWTTPMDYGRFEGEIAVSVAPGDGGESTVHKIKASGKVRTAIAFFSPDIDQNTGLDVGTLVQGKKHEFHVVTRLRGGLARKLSVLKVEPKEMKATLEPISPEGSYRLTLTFDENCPMVIFNADQKHGYVQVGDPDDPKFMNWFPVMGAVVKID